MEAQQLSLFKISLDRAPVDQVLEIEIVVRDIIARRVAEASLARRTILTLEHRECPHCQTGEAKLHGRDKNGRQRFRCVNAACRRTYNILTGTPMARARKPEKWGQYLAHMTDFRSVRDIVSAGIGVNHVTVWRWRHRFLKAAHQTNAGRLAGIIEADETFFVRSFKGHRGWQKDRPPADRAARPTAWGAMKRGLSSEQVPVLTALDSSGAIFEAILPSLAGIEAALAGRIAASSVLCSDGAKAYAKVAVAAGSEHRRIEIVKADWLTKAKGRPRRKKRRLGLGHVNAHHERLKTFINRRCRGVASRYLDNYLGWNRAMRDANFSGVALLTQSLMCCPLQVV